MVAVVGVDAELVDHLEGVLAPILDVHQGVIERRAVVAGAGVDLAQGLDRGEDIGGDDLVEQPRKFAVREANAIESLELLARICLQRGAIADIRAVRALQAFQRTDKPCSIVPSRGRQQVLVWTPPRDADHIHQDHGPIGHHLEEEPMSTIQIGGDVAKTVFEVAISEAPGGGPAGAV